MFKVLLALHLLTAVFAIGPLVGAATTAARGVRAGDAGATAAAARMLRIYAFASVIVVAFGFALMSATNPHGSGHVGEFGQTWIWLSLLLWAVAIAIVLAVLVPSLQRVTTALGTSRTAAGLTGRVAAAGGVVGLIFAAIVFLMVYQPGR